VKLYFGLELSHSIVPSALAMADKRESGGLSFKF